MLPRNPANNAQAIVTYINGLTDPLRIAELQAIILAGHNNIAPLALPLPAAGAPGHDLVRAAIIANAAIANNPAIIASLQGVAANPNDQTVLDNAGTDAIFRAAIQKHTELTIQAQVDAKVFATIADLNGPANAAGNADAIRLSLHQIAVLGNVDFLGTQNIANDETILTNAAALRLQTRAINKRSTLNKAPIVAAINAIAAAGLPLDAIADAAPVAGGAPNALAVGIRTAINAQIGVAGGPIVANPFGGGGINDESVLTDADAVALQGIAIQKRSSFSKTPIFNAIRAITDINNAGLTALTSLAPPPVTEDQIRQAIDSQRALLGGINFGPNINNQKVLSNVDALALHKAAKNQLNYLNVQQAIMAKTDAHDLALNGLKNIVLAAAAVGAPGLAARRANAKLVRDQLILLPIGNIGLTNAHANDETILTHAHAKALHALAGKKHLELDILEKLNAILPANAAEIAVLRQISAASGATRRNLIRQALAQGGGAGTLNYQFNFGAPGAGNANLRNENILLNSSADAIQKAAIKKLNQLFPHDGMVNDALAKPKVIRQTLNAHKPQLDAYFNNAANTTQDKDAFIKRLSDASKSKEDILSELVATKEFSTPKQIADYHAAVAAHAAGGGAGPAPAAIPLVDGTALAQALFAQNQFKRMSEDPKGNPEFLRLLAVHQSDVVKKIATFDAPKDVKNRVDALIKADKNDIQAKMSDLGFPPALAAAEINKLFGEREYERIINNPKLNPALKQVLSDLNNAPLFKIYIGSSLNTSAEVDKEIRNLTTMDEAGIRKAMMTDYGFANPIAQSQSFYADREYERIYAANPALQSLLKTYENSVKAQLQTGALDSPEKVDACIKAITEADLDGANKVETKLQDLGIPGALAAAIPAADYDNFYAEKAYHFLHKNVPADLQEKMERRKAQIIAKLRTRLAPPEVHKSDTHEKVKKQLSYLVERPVFNSGLRQNVAKTMEDLGIIDRMPGKQHDEDNIHHPYVDKVMKDSKQVRSDIEERLPNIRVQLSSIIVLSNQAAHSETAKENLAKYEKYVNETENLLSIYKLQLERELEKHPKKHASILKKLDSVEDGLLQIKMIRDHAASLPSQLTHIAYVGDKAEKVKVDPNKAGYETLEKATESQRDAFLQDGIAGAGAGIGIAAGGLASLSKSAKLTETFKDAPRHILSKVYIPDPNDKTKTIHKANIVTEQGIDSKDGVYKSRFYFIDAEAAKAGTPQPDVLALNLPRMNASWFRTGLPNPIYIRRAFEAVANHEKGNPDSESGIRIFGDNYEKDQVEAFILVCRLKEMTFTNTTNFRDLNVTSDQVDALRSEINKDTKATKAQQDVTNPTAATYTSRFFETNAEDHNKAKKEFEKFKDSQPPRSRL